MHQCEEFRERITEHIIDREDLSRKSAIQSELLLCTSCSDFYAESREMMEALSSAEFAVPDEQWDSMTHRLRIRIINERIQAPAPKASRSRWLAWDFGVPALAAMAAVMLLTVGLYRIAAPLVEETQPITAVSDRQLLADYDVTLDPVTADFLEQSELLLRNVMKLEPSHTEDLQEAKERAAQHLISLDQRIEAASSMPPVQTMMSKYETILRDIRNLNKDTAAEDIIDIQSRIEKNGLIADMKSFQPVMTAADVDEQY